MAANFTCDLDSNHNPMGTRNLIRVPMDTKFYKDTTDELPWEDGPAGAAYALVSARHLNELLMEAIVVDVLGWQCRAHRRGVPTEHPEVLRSLIGSSIESHCIASSPKC